MNRRNNTKASAAEVFGSIKFTGKHSVSPAHPWPATGFARNKSTYVGQSLLEDHKLVRSSN